MQPSVLIVDDEPHLLRLFVRVFEREGYAVHATGEGRQACDWLADEAVAISVLVLDAGIAPVGAIDVLEKVSAHRPGIGVLIVSGDHLPGPLADGLTGHGGHFLRKPFLPAALVDAVRRAVEASPDSAG